MGRSVFMNETFAVAASDPDLMYVRFQMKHRRYRKAMMCLFEELDLDKDGKIDIDEFTHAVQTPQMKLTLASMNVDSDDPITLFNILDKGDGILTEEDLIRGIERVG